MGCDDRAQPIGSYYYASLVRFPRPASRIPRDHAGDRTVVVQNLLNLETLDNLRAGCFSSRAQDRVEARARQRIAERLEPADRGGATRRHDLHAGEPARSGRGDGRENLGAQALEHTRGFGTEVFGARLVARKARAIEQQDPRAAARKVPSRGWSRGGPAEARR